MLIERSLAAAVATERAGAQRTGKLTLLRWSDIVVGSISDPKEHSMAQGTAVKHKKKTKSVLKNIRQTERRAAINRMNRTRVRTAIRRMRAALSASDAPGAEKLASATFSELDKAIRKRTLTENTANRYKSRLALALNAIKAKK